MLEFFFRGNLEDDEEILFVAHKHIFNYYPELFKSLAIGVAIPVALWLFLPPLYVYWLTWIALGISWFLYVLSDWYFDVWLITNLGVVDIEWNGFFHKTCTRVEYQTIEGVSYEIKGFWGTVLRFGNIKLDKIGSIVGFGMDGAANPKRIEGQIMKHQQEYLHRRAVRDHDSLKDMIADMLQIHHKQ